MVPAFSAVKGVGMAASGQPSLRGPEAEVNPSSQQPN